MIKNPELLDEFYEGKVYAHRTIHYSVVDLTYTYVYKVKDEQVQVWGPKWVHSNTWDNFKLYLLFTDSFYIEDVKASWEFEFFPKRHLRSRAKGCTPAGLINIYTEIAKFKKEQHETMLRTN